jgi:hypothetical protein
MLKTVSALAFVGLLLVAAVTPAAAVSIFSTSHASDIRLHCIDGATLCGAVPGVTDNVFVVNNPLPGAWTPTSPFNANAKWISYNAATSQGGSGPASTSLAAPNVTIDFDLGIISTLSTLTLHVWADDTAAVKLNNGIGTVFATDPLATYTQCASSGITCGGTGTLISVLLPANISDYHLSFDLFQRGNSGTPFGLMFDGELAPVPEPATILLLGSALAAAGIASRRKFQKPSQQ